MSLRIRGGIVVIFKKVYYNGYVITAFNNEYCMYNDVTNNLLSRDTFVSVARTDPRTHLHCVTQALTGPSVSSISAKQRRRRSSVKSPSKVSTPIPDWFGLSHPSLRVLDLRFCSIVDLVDECYSDHRFSENSRLVKNIGKVVLDLRNLGFTSMAEDAYSSAIFLLLKAKVHDVAGDDFQSSVLQSIKSWIQVVPLQFLHALLVYLGDVVSYESTSSGLKSPLAPQPSSCCPGIDTPSEGLVRWKLRLEYFAYETLQDLRIAKLFEIIVDYPESSPAIEDLKLCLEYTGQHSKLVESFISALRYRLLTAGASTNDILHQYVSTIKALRTIDPAGVFLEAVGEPIRDYLRGRRDTIKPCSRCVAVLLPPLTAIATSTCALRRSNCIPSCSVSYQKFVEFSLDETKRHTHLIPSPLHLNRDEEIQENAGVDDDFNTNDRQAWLFRADGNLALWKQIH
ncbi:Anaphase-promoting complex subunit 2 [Glycine max]|nr:Anaphase-promoting complex subunit 2 [Glycine max]